MSVTSASRRPAWKFHPQAYGFTLEALRVAQEAMGRSALSRTSEPGEESAHVSGPELMEGVRQHGLKLFGPMAPVVFRQWGLRSTDDFGRLVFELIEHGKMRKTDRDQLSDFADLFDFDEAFREHYVVDTSKAFVRKDGNAE